MWSRTADSFLAAPHALAKSLPLTLSALQSGTISWQHALVMVDETATLDSAGAAALERHFLDPDAPKPATAAPVGDLPAHQASAAWNRLTAAARGLQGPAEARTLTQLRADLCGDWLLGGMSTTTGGYGPIPPSMARKLTADGAGSFYRVLVDPRDGAPLEIGRTSYRLTKAMRTPGQRSRPHPCLGQRWHHRVSNLGQPCPKHHRLRHASRWKPTPPTKNEPPGWTSPSGRHYRAEHQDWEPPHWPRQSRPVTSDSGPVTGNVPAAAGPIPPRAPALPQSPHRRFRPGAGRSGQTWP